MRYIIQQKLLSIGDDFSIDDENGSEAYYVDGKTMTFAKTLVVKDRAKREIATIKQKLFTFDPTYRIIRDARPEIIVKKRRFSFRDSFVIDMILHSKRS